MNFKITEIIKKFVIYLKSNKFKKYLYVLPTGIVLMYTLRHFQGYNFLNKFTFEELIAEIVIAYIIGSLVSIIPFVYFSIYRDYFYDNQKDKLNKYSIFEIIKDDDILLCSIKIAFMITISLCMFLLMFTLGVKNHI